MRKLIASLTAASMLLSFNPNAIASQTEQQQEPQRVETAQTQSLEDRLKAIPDHDNQPLVTEQDLAEFRKKNVDLKEALAIATVQTGPNSVFCREYFRNYLLGGGNYAHVSSLIRSQKASGNQSASLSDGSILDSLNSKKDDAKCKGTNLPA